MRRTIAKYDPVIPLVSNENGVVSNLFNFWMSQVYERGLIIGTGSPEGVVEANQGTEYMDDEGAAGAVLYIKQKTSIGDDTKKGWVAIG